MEWFKRHRPPTPIVWNVLMVMAAIATALCCASQVWADVTVFDDDEFFFLYFSLLLVIPVVVWFVLVVVACIRYAGWWRLGILVPAFIVVTVALAALSVPGRIVWLMTRSEMNQAAAACVLEGTRPGEAYDNETIGLYKFRSVESWKGNCSFDFPRYYPVVRSGFIYQPNGEDLISDIDFKYVRLDDSWYYYRW